MDVACLNKDSVSIQVLDNLAGLRWSDKTVFEHIDNNNFKIVVDINKKTKEIILSFFQDVFKCKILLNFEEYSDKYSYESFLKYADEFIHGKIPIYQFVNDSTIKAKIVHNQSCKNCKLKNTLGDMYLCV